MGKNGPVMNGIKVLLNNNIEVLTDENGKFLFDAVKFGNHILKPSAEDVQFDELKVQLTMSTTDLIVKPSNYKVCFFVSIDSASGINIPWTINIIGTKYRHEVQTGSTGSGCIFLKPDDYKASIYISPQDEEAGIRFGPSEHVFTVESQPIKKLTFSQFLGEIHGIIQCLESCRTLTVSLRPSKGNYGSPRTTTATQGKFIFREVVPAEYLLSVDKEEWCWKEPTILVVVNAKNVSAKFEQTGFRLTLNASHRTTLNYVTNKGHTGKLEVSEGTSRECVSAPGKYVFTPASCHKFGSAPLTWDTSSLQLLSLIASHHQVTGTLISREPGPFSITVKSEQNSEAVIGPLIASHSDKSVYPFEIWLENGETVTLIPSSSSNLFQYSPSSFTLKVADECMFSVVQFEAERALFIKGHVKPALKGVTIKVIGDGEELSFTTNAEGFFVAGPLDKSQSYNVVAEKVGYIMNPPSQRIEVEGRDMSTLKMSFNAYKLAEIIVKITDENGEPLEGVLVSTSGGKDYRQNSLTEADGTYIFQSLMPSDYFLRPMMKEYNFNPPSQMVEVQGGATVNVEIKGVRVAYSIFGHTTSLSGEPESDVMVEALGIGSHCSGLQEEALSDSQGNFRIRGLTPNCDYKIRLKKGEGINSHVDRSLPKERDVHVSGTDYKGLVITVMRPFLQMDVSVIVDAEPQFVSTLTAELYRDDSLDSPVHSVAIGNHPFFMLPPMIMDNRTYSIQLLSSLSQNHYEYIIKPVSFVANSSFIHMTIPFKPNLKMVDAEISRSTVFGLLFFVFVILIILNYSKVQPFVLQAIETYYNKRPNNNGKSSTKVISQSQIPCDTAYIEPVNVRKRMKVRKT
ncbi:Nodal modulator 1 [Armadillidium nasatum]|uniref:Nodal modulator 1 n=1 Tax=Armadillidium nasatum TaxID=96803 RepID=A0A5N5SKW6_9CRUS|nr:Nodal modulator 1 [Armadillidium nasatum]